MPFEVEPEPACVCAGESDGSDVVRRYGGFLQSEGLALSLSRPVSLALFAMVMKVTGTVGPTYTPVNFPHNTNTHRRGEMFWVNQLNWHDVKLLAFGRNRRRPVSHKLAQPRKRLSVQFVLWGVGDGFELSNQLGVVVNIEAQVQQHGSLEIHRVSGLGGVLGVRVEDCFDKLSVAIFDSAFVVARELSQYAPATKPCLRSRNQRAYMDLILR